MTRSTGAVWDQRGPIILCGKLFKRQETVPEGGRAHKVMSGHHLWCSTGVSFDSNITYFLY